MSQSYLINKPTYCRKRMVSYMIGIRTDANDKIAMGHLVRCMSIARQLRKKHLEVVFILSENNAEEFIIENGFRLICLNNHYDEKEQELASLLELVRREKIDRLLIDSYEVTNEYMRRLKEICKTVYIDDYNQFKYPVDMIVNYTYGADFELYRANGYKREQILLGSKYVPLRPEFAQSRIMIKQDIKSVFLSTGGTDHYNVMVCLLKKLQKSQLKDVIKYVITGKFYKYKEELATLCKQDSTICNYHDIQDVHSIMCKSDLAITAGGTTLSELCACGIPTICLSIADNQHSGIKAYAKAEMIFYAGDIRDKKDKTLENVVCMAEYLNSNEAVRKKMGEKAKKVVDGKGASRIADEILNL